MESETLKAIAQYGLGGLLAVFMFLLYRRDILEAKRQEAVYAQEHRERAKECAEVIINNTRAMAHLESTNEQLARAIEASNILASREAHQWGDHNGKV